MSYDKGMVSEFEPRALGEKKSGPPPYTLFLRSHRKGTLTDIIRGLQPGEPVELPKTVYSVSSAERIARELHGARRVKFRRHEGRIWVCLLREGDL